VVRDEGTDYYVQTAQLKRTSTGPTATCGVSVSSRSCATSLSIIYQVEEDGGKR
jgi:hypothetical protein